MLRNSLVLVWLLQLGESARLAISSENTTNLALGVVLADRTFKPMLSRPAGENDLWVHAPIRPHDTYLEYKGGLMLPSIVLSGISPTLEFNDTSTGQSISISKPEGTPSPPPPTPPDGGDGED